MSVSTVDQWFALIDHRLFTKFHALRLFFIIRINFVLLCYNTIAPWVWFRIGVVILKMLRAIAANLADKLLIYYPPDNTCVYAPIFAPVTSTEHKYRNILTSHIEQVEVCGLRTRTTRKIGRIVFRRDTPEKHTSENK